MSSRLTKPSRGTGGTRVKSGRLLQRYRTTSFGLESDVGFVTVALMNGGIHPAASALVNDVLMQIAKQVDGNYQGADYFSLP